MDLKQRKQTNSLSIPMDGAGGEAERKPLKRVKGGGGAGVGSLLLLATVTLLMGAGGTWYYFTTVFLKTHDAALAQENQVEWEKQQLAHDTALQAQLAKFDSDKQALQRQLSAHETQQSEKEKELADQQVRVAQLAKYKKKIQDSIQAYSKKRLESKYGPGPHYVEFTVAFDPASNVGTADKPPEESIVVELALPDYMPHAVYWFLEQVDGKMYDYCSFHRNAGHVIQAGPSKNFLTPGDAQLNKPFRQAGLESVLFQEYSEKYPHVKYTLGYAGRPGGPDFYISMQDNSKNHGPGGQSSYEDPTEADPCFGKVVQGTQVAERIHQSHVKPGNYHAMEHNVAIKSIRVVKYDPATGTIERPQAEQPPAQADQQEQQQEQPDQQQAQPDEQQPDQQEEQQQDQQQEQADQQQEQQQQEAQEK